jgi:hypothetical protein
VYEKITEEIEEDSSLIPKVSFYAIGPLSGEDGGNTNYDVEDLKLARVFFHSGLKSAFFCRNRISE